MTELSWRSASKADRQLLEQFTCTTTYGPDYEQIVQRYFRVQAIAHAGGHDAIRTDHRLLLLFLDEDLAGAACHRLNGPDTRHVVFAALRLDLQGITVSDGPRVSEALWAAVLQDIRYRPGIQATTLYARVDPNNARSLAFCTRMKLKPGPADANGLIICSGPLE